jgi:hypothetical protein
MVCNLPTRSFTMNTHSPMPFFWPFFENNFTNASFLERFQKMYPDLGAMDCGAELTRHDALDQGAEMIQFLASVCERGVRRGQGGRRPDLWRRPSVP